jgi:hypothetical protein
MDGNNLVATCTLSLDSKEIPTYTLIDCGATGYVFIDQDFANHHHLPICPLKTPCTLEVIDGRKISSGDITHIPKGTLASRDTGRNSQYSSPNWATTLLFLVFSG